VIPRYPEGQIKSRLEGFVRQGAVTFVEPTVYLVGLLNENWDPTHVDNRPCIIDRSKAWVGQDYADLDYVLITPLPGSEQPVGLGYTHTHETLRLQVEILSKGLQGQRGGTEDLHFQKVVNEVRRIVMLHRRNFFRGVANERLGGVSWVKWGIQETPADKIARGHTRRTFDIEIRRRWKPIITDWKV